MTPSMIRFGERQKVYDERCAMWEREIEPRVNFGNEWIMSFSASVASIINQADQLHEVLSGHGLDFRVVSMEDYCAIYGYPEGSHLLMNGSEIIITAEIMPPGHETVLEIGKALVALTEDMNSDGVGFYDHS